MIILLSSSFVINKTSRRRNVPSVCCIVLVQILRRDKEVQFHLGHDDTALENLMRRLRSARLPPGRHPSCIGSESSIITDEYNAEVGADEEKSISTTILKGVYVGYSNSNGSSGAPLSLEFSLANGMPAPIHGSAGNGINSSTCSTAASVAGTAAPLRLGRFLRQACVVMETLCEENILAANINSAVAWSAAQEGLGSSSRRGPSARDGYGDSHEDDDDDCRSINDKSKNGARRFAMFPSKGAGWEEIGGQADGAAPPTPADPELKETRTFHGGRHGASGGGRCGDGSCGNFRALIGESDVVGVAFSRAKRSMLATAHARRGRGWKQERLVREAEGGGERGAGEGMGRVPLEGFSVVCVWNTEDVKVRPKVGSRAMV